MPNLFDFAADEARLVRENFARAGEYAAFADKAIGLLSGLIAVQSRSTILFAAHYAVSRNALFLALLSTLRQHRTQASMSLRTAIEHASLAAYSLSPAGIRAAQAMVEKQELTEDDRFRRDAYRWMRTELPDNSAALQAMKGAINEMEAHANVVGTLPVFDWNVADGSAFVSSFFDKFDIDHMRIGCWRVGSVAQEVTAAIARAAQLRGGVLLNDDGSRYQVLQDMDRRLHDAIVSGGRFKTEADLVLKGIPSVGTESTAFDEQQES